MAWSYVGALFRVWTALIVVSVAQASELQSQFDIRSGANTSFQLEIEIDPEYYDNLDLDQATGDGLKYTKIKFTPTLLYKPNPQVDLVLEGRLERRHVFSDPADYKEAGSILKLREAYLLYEADPNSGLAFQVGRRRFRDEREWLFDANLDALRLVFREGLSALEASVSGEIVDPEEKVINLMLFGRYARSGHQFDAFLIDRRDRESDWHPRWWGLRARGETGLGQRYYLDTALRGGRDGSEHLGGHAFDFGLTHVFNVPWKPSMTASYAYASGDDQPDSGTDRNFRQTKLQDNNGKINGIDNFQYYGIVFSPELSNLALTRLALGLRPSQATSLEMVWHHYRRISVAADVKTLLEADPGAAGTDLGDEVDLLFAYKAKKWRCNLALGRFFPGEAYTLTKPVWGLTGELRIRF